MSTTTNSTQQRLHNAHEHLRHDSTADTPEIVRARNRQVELNGQRQAAEAKTNDGDQNRNQ